MSFPLGPADYAAMAGFRYAVRKFLRFSKEFLAAEPNLTPEQYEALLALKAFSGEDGLRVGELSERLQVKHHTAVTLTDKLRARRLVTKQRGQRDRRHVYVKLTDAGAEFLARLAFVHHGEIRIRSLEMIAALNQIRNRAISAQL